MFWKLFDAVKYLCKSTWCIRKVQFSHSHLSSYESIAKIAFTYLYVSNPSRFFYYYNNNSMKKMYAIISNVVLLYALCAYLFYMVWIVCKFPIALKVWAFVFRTKVVKIKVKDLFLKLSLYFMFIVTRWGVVCFISSNIYIFSIVYNVFWNEKKQKFVWRH